MEQDQQRPELTPESLEAARELLDMYELGDVADLVRGRDGQTQTIAEGLARHYPQAVQMKEEDFLAYVKILVDQPDPNDPAKPTV